jgi:hypothetical protein
MTEENIMRYMLRLLVPLLAAFWLSACASAYKPPTDGPTAKLKIISAGEAAPVLTTYENGDTCTGMHIIHPDRQYYENASNLKLPQGESVSITISTEHAFTLFTYATTPRARINSYNYCSFISSFTPEPGASYEMFVDWDTDDALCAHRVNKAVPTASGIKWIPEQTLRERVMTAMLANGGKGCK